MEIDSDEEAPQEAADTVFAPLAASKPDFKFKYAWGEKKFADATIHVVETPDCFGCSQPSSKESKDEGTKSDASGDDAMLDDSPSERTFHVSKLILGGCSKYFQRMFMQDMAEGRKGDVEIEVNKDELDVFEACIRYVYTNELEVESHEELVCLIRLADRFDLIDVALAACDVLVKRVRDGDDSGDSFDACERALCLPETILDAKWFAPVHEALGAALVHRNPHLHNAWTSKVYSDMGIRTFTLWLSREDLDVASENDVFTIMWEWFEDCYEDPSGNARDVADMLGALRLPCMSRAFLAQFVRNNKGFYNNEGERLAEVDVEEALAFKLLTDQQRTALVDHLKSQGENITRFETRSPQDNHNDHLVISDHAQLALSERSKKIWKATVHSLSHGVCVVWDLKFRQSRKGNKLKLSLYVQPTCDVLKAPVFGNISFDAYLCSTGPGPDDDVVESEVFFCQENRSFVAELDGEWKKTLKVWQTSIDPPSDLPLQEFLASRISIYYCLQF